MKSDEEMLMMLRRLDRSPADGQLSADRARALHDRILSAAAARLAERRTRRTWWEYSAQWARAAVPLGLAASILAATVLLRAPGVTSWDASVEPEATIAAADGDAAHRIIHMAAAGHLAGADMLDSLVGPATRDGLVSQLLRGGR